MRNRRTGPQLGRSRTARLIAVVLLGFLALACWVVAWHLAEEPRSYRMVGTDASNQVRLAAQERIDREWEDRKVAEKASRGSPRTTTTTEGPRTAGASKKTTGAKGGAKGGTGGPRAAGEGIWRALAVCESGGNPRSVSASGRYRGAFQFSLSTWHSLGMGGDPIDHSYAVQLDAAKRLQARSGWGQWPSCARQLGLI